MGNNSFRLNPGLAESNIFLNVVGPRDHSGKFDINRKPLYILTQAEKKLKQIAEVVNACTWLHGAHARFDVCRSASGQTIRF